MPDNRIFDLATVPVNEHVPAPSDPTADRSTADRRRTLARAAQLDAGIHPRTRLPLANNGHTCGDCAHHVINRRAGTYHKCDNGVPGAPFRSTYLTGGPATDIRVGWPACTDWAADTDDPA